MAGRTGPVRLLVTGGSQGARSLNRLLPEALRQLPAGLQLEIRHQCGRDRADETRAGYREAGIEMGTSCGGPLAGDRAQARSHGQSANSATGASGRRVEVSEFIEDMATAYGWADVVVCRAGALTVSEVAAAGLAALFIPFPHAVDDHQARNAEYLVERGAAVLLTEPGLDARTLGRALNELLSDRRRQLEMALRSRASAAPRSADQVAELCAEYIVR